MSDQQAKVPGRDAPPPKPKRVYKTVSVSEDGDVFGVLLDGKPVRTPLRKTLGARTRALAEALAQEWDAQDPVIDREAMPLTRLVSTALDRVGPEREEVIAALMSYVDAELLCYRAEHPADLKTRQQRTWDPVLEWLRAAHGADLACVEGIMPASQSPDSVAALQAALTKLDDERLTAFQACAAATKSLALAFALVDGPLTAEQVAAAAHLDEIYQAEQWGEDAEALARRKAINAEIKAIGEFLKLAIP
ncbi:MAG: ATP12 family protein [Rhodospirillaceae bacterium]